MANDYQELSRYLQRLEHELRLLGWWSYVAPSEDALHSGTPFCHDSMTFDQWLQWVFIPSIQEILQNKKTLPDKCAIAPMAEIAWATEPPTAIAGLTQLLLEIDALVSGRS
jgi:uncharacterized protein YqcC (DUF446 family)